jgi:hypothetical protein
MSIKKDCLERYLIASTCFLVVARKAYNFLGGIEEGACEAEMMKALAFLSMGAKRRRPSKNCGSSHNLFPNCFDIEANRKTY